MSFIDQILDVGGSLWKAFTGPGTGAAIARATTLGYLLKEVTDSINADNQKPTAAGDNKPDYGVREQVDPDTEHSIPVVYGTAFLGGIVTDAVLTNDNQTMWYCITICEKTGNLIDGTASVISFEEIYWNQNKLNFQSDGVTVASFTDEDGNTSTSVAGKIKVYCYSGNSSSPVAIKGYSLPSPTVAYSLFPNWTISHQMSDLVFALIRVDYDKANDVTGLGNLEFKIKNTMNQPGDVLNDYMTNTRYGAGIVPEEIYSE